MKERYLYLGIGVGLILIFFLIRYLYEPKVYSNEALSKLIDAENINKIEITTKESKTIIEKRNNIWLMSEPYQWRCDDNETKQLISKLQRATLYGPLTKNKNNYHKFEISDNSPIITLYTPSKKLSFAYGKEGSSFNSVFIKPVEKDEIYELNGVASYDLKKEPIELLARSVLTMDDAEIESIKILYHSKEFNLIKKDNQWDSEKSKKIYEKLRSLRFSSIEKTKPSSKPQLVLNITSKSSTAILNVYQRKEGYDIEVESVILRIDKYDAKGLDEIKEMLK